MALAWQALRADVRIGVLVPDSGPAGLFGPSARQAAQLAAEDTNAEGGINGEPVELVFADVGVPPAQAVQSVQRLWRSQGVQGFVGMHDGAVRAAITGQLRGRVPYMSTQPSMRAASARQAPMSPGRRRHSGWRRP